MSLPNLTTLLKQSQIIDHEEVLRAASSTSVKSDPEAQQARIVALLKLDRFEDAVKAVASSPKDLKEKVKLEHAYALYKSGKRKDAIDLIQAVQSRGRGLQHVEAQALYGQEEFTEAAELYKELSRNAFEDNVADLRVNTLAVNAQLEWQHLGENVTDKSTSKEDFQAHESLYNTACSSIARGELGQAEVLLKSARNVCEKLQDLNEDEKAIELLPISLQQVYVLTRLGRLEEAEALSQGINAELTLDAVTKHLVKVNTTAARSTIDNPFLLERQLAANDSDLEKPFSFQTDIFTRNQYALDLAAMKYAGTISTTQTKINQQSTSSIASSTNTLSVVNAAAHARNQVGKDALKHILPLLERRPTDIGLILTVVQLYVLTNNIHTATELLQKFLTRLEEKDNTEVRYAPGLVGTVVSLYSRQGRRDDAKSELAKAAAYWKDKSNNLTPGTIHLLKAAGSTLLSSESSDDVTLAKTIFEMLYTRDNQDKYAAAGLLASTTSDSVNKSALTTIEKLLAKVDVDALESTGIAHKSSQQQPASRKRPATEAPIRQKAKKIRKSKMPKDYDASKTPDPERWLPLRDRSSYRPKGKKGKARQAMLSQGAVASESDGSRPATPGGEIMKAKTAQGGNNNNKKKKAKGKK